MLFQLFWNERKATDIGIKEVGRHIGIKEVGRHIGIKEVDKHIGIKKGDKHIGKERKNRRFRDFSKKKKKNVDKIIRHIVIYRSCLENRREHNCGCSSMVECQPSKLNTWVRFPSPAFFAQIAQSVEQRTENPRVTGSIPVLGICHTCASGRVVLCLLAKEKVAGSIPVSRSQSKSEDSPSIFFYSQRVDQAKPETSFITFLLSY